MKAHLPLVILLITTIFSQGTKAQGWSFGIHADPQLSWFTSDTRRFNPNGPVTGFNVGVSAKNFFTERYAYHLGLSINSLGGILQYTEPNQRLVTRDSTYTLPQGTNVRFRGQYLTIPLGLHFKTTEIGFTTIYAEAGMQGHIRLQGFAWENSQKIEREAVPNNQTFPNFLSYSIGLGIKQSLGGPSALQAGVYYSNGLTPAFDGGHGRVSIGSLSLRLGIVF